MNRRSGRRQERRKRKHHDKKGMVCSIPAAVFEGRRDWTDGERAEHRKALEEGGARIAADIERKIIEGFK